MRKYINHFFNMLNCELILPLLRSTAVKDILHSVDVDVDPCKIFVRMFMMFASVPAETHIKKSFPQTDITGISVTLRVTEKKKKNTK